jgi:hypothetical protein
MATNRHLKRQSEKDLNNLFRKTVDVIQDTIGSKAFRPRRAVNAAVVDSLMTGIAKRVLEKGQVKNKTQLQEQYDKLMKTQAYLAAVETGTSQEANVETRLRLAREAFKGVR